MTPPVLLRCDPNLPLEYVRLNPTLSFYEAFSYLQPTHLWVHLEWKYIGAPVEENEGDYVKSLRSYQPEQRPHNLVRAYRAATNLQQRPLARVLCLWDDHLPSHLLSVLITHKPLDVSVGTAQEPEWAPKQDTPTAGMSVHTLALTLEL